MRLKVLLSGASYLITLIGFVVYTTGCAQIVRGSTTTVAVNSAPGGATVISSTGAGCQTPCALELDRKTNTALTISTPGYQPASVQLVSDFNVGWFVLDLLLTGVFALISFSGGLYDLNPGTVMVTLQPQVGSEGTLPKVVQLTCKPNSADVDSIACNISEVK